MLSFAMRMFYNELLCKALQCSALCWFAKLDLRLLLGVAGWLLLAVAGCCWLLLAVAGCCWLLLAGRDAGGRGEPYPTHVKRGQLRKIRMTPACPLCAARWRLA